MVSEFDMGSSVSAKGVASLNPSKLFLTDSCTSPENHNFIIWVIIKFRYLKLVKVKRRRGDRSVGRGDGKNSSGVRGSNKE